MSSLYGGGKCKLCGSDNANAATCPLNPKAKNPNPKKHFNANKSTIENQTGANLVISSEEIVSIGNDKWKTYKYLKANNFNFPKSCLPNEVAKFIRTNSFPMIVQPIFRLKSRH